jgi:hypothetical protein
VGSEAALKEDSMLKLRPVVLIAMIAAAAALRLAPHPPNFSPIAAMGLFGGAYLTNRAAGFLAPLGALFLSDLILGFYPHMEIVYGALALSVCLGWLLRRDRSPWRVGGVAIAASVSFFLLTNLGVWLFETMYPRTLGGLAACYTAALPFFQNTIAGDLCFSALLFGGFALAERLAPALRAEPAAHPNPA